MKNPEKPFIPDPCPMHWHAMKSADGGRYCDQCQKVVVDMRNKSPEEIKAIAEENEGEVCGQFRVDQLSHSPEQRRRRDRRRQRVRTAAAFVLAAGIIANPGVAPATATGRFYTPPLPGPNFVFPKDIVLKGSAGWKMDGVKVRLKKIDLQTTTDSLGNYMLRIPAAYRGKSMKLVFSMKGYRPDKHTLKLDQADTINVDANMSLRPVFISTSSPTAWFPVRPRNPRYYFTKGKYRY